MGLVNIATIKPEIQNYVANGSTANFVNPEGKMLTGHIFTRQELFDALDNSATTEYFMVSALSPYPDTSDLFLNLVLCRVDQGVIDTNGLYVSSVPPVTTEFSFETNTTTNPDDEEVTAAEFTTMFNNYLNGSESEVLKLGSGEKVKGYNISRSKIQELGLDVPPTGSNYQDTFAFIPMVRPTDSLTTKPYLTFALVQVDKDLAIGDIAEFSDPCPRKCNGYELVFK